MFPKSVKLYKPTSHCLGMADINASDVLNPVDLASSFWESAPPELLTKWLTLLHVGKIAGVVVIVYIVVLIVARILKFRDSRNIRLIKNNVIEINKKLDGLGKWGGKKEKESKSKADDKKK